MRLDDAVFVLAPKPKPPSMPTRRAFLMAGVAFVAGTSLGGACGYAMGAKQAEAGAEAAKDEPLVSSGNAELDELRRLAVKAPLKELMGRAEWYYQLVQRDYWKDPILWKGTERIAVALIDGFDFPNRRLFALLLAQFIEKSDPGISAPYLKLAPQLRAIK